MKKPLILVVEDDAQLAQVLASITAINYDSEIVYSLEQAKKRVALQPLPDCIILDLLLPNGAGMELVNELDKHTPSIPIVVLSGYDVSEKACRAAGAQAVLMKPVGGAVLLNTIEKTMDEWVHHTPQGRLAKLQRSMKLLDDELKDALKRVKEPKDIAPKEAT